MKKLTCVGYIESLEEAVSVFPEMKNVTAIRIRDFLLSVPWRGDFPYFGPGFMAQQLPYSYLKKYESFSGKTDFEGLPARWTYEMGIKPADKEWSRIVWQMLGEEPQLKSVKDALKERFREIPSFYMADTNEWISKRNGDETIYTSVPVKLRYRRLNCNGWL